MIKKILFGGKIEIAISEVTDGNMRFFGSEDEAEIIKNQEKLGKTLKLEKDKIARVRTIYENRMHFTDYHEITNQNLPQYSIENPEEQIPVSDGLITRCSDIGFLLPLADCLGIVVFDEEQEIIGLLHAGRQNVEQLGPKKFIEFLIKTFNSKPEKLKLYFSPHATSYQIFKLNNQLLPEAAKEQLTEAGVLLANIIDSKIDTVSSKNFPSHSGGDTTQRFAIAVRRVVKEY